MSLFLMSSEFLSIYDQGQTLDGIGTVRPTDSTRDAPDQACQSVVIDDAFVAVQKVRPPEQRTDAQANHLSLPRRAAPVSGSECLVSSS